MGTYARQSRTAHPKFRSVALPAGALVGANVLLMYAVAAVPQLAGINDVLFRTPVLGLVVYGAALTGGNYLAERGLEAGDVASAAGGIVLLQAAYGLFGGGILGRVAPDLRAAVLGVTLVATLLMTLGVGAYVYLRDRRFDHWNRWSLGAFVVGVVLVLVGTFVPIALVGGFAFIFAGFTLRLGYEIWKVRDGYDPDRSLVHALGIYVAFTGVFVHVLQIVRQFAVNR